MALLWLCFWFQLWVRWYLLFAGLLSFFRSIYCTWFSQWRGSGKWCYCCHLLFGLFTLVAIRLFLTALLLHFLDLLCCFLLLLPVCLVRRHEALDGGRNTRAAGLRAPSWVDTWKHRTEDLNSQRQRRWQERLGRICVEALQLLQEGVVILSGSSSRSGGRILIVLLLCLRFFLSFYIRWLHPYRGPWLRCPIACPWLSCPIAWWCPWRLPAVPLSCLSV